MTRALESRLDRFERRTRKAGSSPAAIEAWINRCLDDPAFMVDQIRLHPARPGSHAAAINAELLDLAPWIAAGGMLPHSCRGNR